MVGSVDIRLLQNCAVCVCMSFYSEHQTHTRTEWNDIRPQTTQFYNERISTDPILVTWPSTVYKPPEDGFQKRPKHVGTSVKCF